MRITKATDIEPIKPIAMQWKAECNGETMGIALDPEVYFRDLAKLLNRDDAELLLLTTGEGENEVCIGYMGIVIFDSPLGPQKIASEHYWYVAKEHRGRGSRLLIKKAKEWAKEKGCSHLVMNASTLASALHDKVCRLYEYLGFTKFETSYIMEI